MSDNEVQRMKDDMAVIERAIGLSPSMGREEVWVNLALAGGGLVALVWALLPTGLPAQWGMVPLILLAIGYLVRMRAKYRRSGGRSPTRRRAYTADLVGMVVVAGLAVIYRVWATKQGISLTLAGSAAFFIFGLAMVLTVLRDQTRLPDLGLAIPLMICGLVIPLSPVSLWVPVGAALALGGAARAMLAARQFRGSVVSNATD